MRLNYKEIIQEFSLPGVIVYLNVKPKARDFAWTSFNVGQRVYVTHANREEERGGSRNVPSKEVFIRLIEGIFSRIAKIFQCCSPDIYVQPICPAAINFCSSYIEDFIFRTLRSTDVKQF